MVTVTCLLGVAIVLGTTIFTALRHNRLPERVPVHFGITGIGDSYGPRQSIWLIVGLQYLFAVAFSVLYETGRDRAMLITGVGVLAALMWAQVQIVSAAISGKNRIPVLLYWIVFVGILAAMAVAAQVLR